MKRPRQRSFLSFENRRRAEQCRRDAPQSAARLPSHARYGVRAVESGNDSQNSRGEATYTGPTLRSVCSPSSQKPAMQAFLWGFQRGYSLLRKRIPPLPRATPSALPSPAPSKGENQKGASSSKREYPLCVGDSDKHTDPVRQHGDDAPCDGNAEEDDRHGAL